MSVVIGRFEIDAAGEAAVGAKAAAPASKQRAPSPPAAAIPAAPVRVQAQSVLRHHRDRLARLRSS